MYSPEDVTVSKEVKGKIHTFYQALIDSRDCPFIVSKCYFNWLMLIVVRKSE